VSDTPRSFAPDKQDERDTRSQSPLQSSGSDLRDLQALIEARLKDGRRVRERVYNISVLQDHHREMLRRSMLGESHKDIGDSMNYTAQQVSNVVNSPVAIARSEELSARADDIAVDVSLRIKRFAETVCLGFAEDLITGRVEGASLSLRARTTENYLARAGFGAITKVHSINERVTREDMEKLKERQRAALADGAIPVKYQESHGPHEVRCEATEVGNGVGRSRLGGDTVTEKES
jgi:hypothetical protein